MGRNLYVHCSYSRCNAGDTARLLKGRAGDHACLPEASESRGGCVETRA